MGFRAGWDKGGSQGVLVRAKSRQSASGGCLDFSCPWFKGEISSWLAEERAALEQPHLSWGMARQWHHSWGTRGSK